MATANVADKPLGRRIDPADDSRCVEDVARDADAVQSLLDVAADCQAGGHHGSVADPRDRASFRTARYVMGDLAPSGGVNAARAAEPLERARTVRASKIASADNSGSENLD